MSILRFLLSPPSDTGSIDKPPVFRLSIRMSRIASCLILSLLTVINSWGNTDTNYLAGFTWPVGEKLTYKLYWGVIPVGSAVVWTEWADFERQRLLAIRLRTVSNKIIEKIYPVNDVIESLIDPTTFLPVQFTKNMSEGSHRHHEITRFDRINRVANWESKITKETRIFKIDADTRDIPSFMYFMRNQRFAPGKRDHFRSWLMKKFMIFGSLLIKMNPLICPDMTPWNVSRLNRRPPSTVSLSEKGGCGPGSQMTPDVWRPGWRPVFPLPMSTPSSSPWKDPGRISGLLRKNKNNLCCGKCRYSICFPRFGPEVRSGD